MSKGPASPYRLLSMEVGIETCGCAPAGCSRRNCPGSAKASNTLGQLPLFIDTSPMPVCSRCAPSAGALMAEQGKELGLIRD